MVSLLKIEFSSETKSISFYNNVNGEKLPNGGGIEWKRLAHGSNIDSMLTSNEDNTFTLRPINCFNSQCQIEFKINGKRITNKQIPQITNIKIQAAHLRSVFMIKAESCNYIRLFRLSNGRKGNPTKIQKYEKLNIDTCGRTFS